MSDRRFVPLPPLPALTADERLARVLAFERDLQSRRTVRSFSPEPVARDVIDACLRTAGSAPSGAHQQPWHFVAVSDKTIKRRIREAAEAEERAFYQRRAPREWLAALDKLGTDEHKPFLEIAPWLIVVFLQRFGRAADGTKTKHYYTDESVGIACGLLLAALHHAGLATLTHTPSPMGFLCDILGRPRDIERPYMIVVAGLPAPDAVVPDLQRKSLDEIATFIE